MIRRMSLFLTRFKKIKIQGSILLFARIISRLKLLNLKSKTLITSLSTVIHKKATKTSSKPFKQHLMETTSKTTPKLFSGKATQNLTRTCNNKNPNKIIFLNKTKTNLSILAPESPATPTVQNSPNSSNSHPNKKSP